MQHYKNVFSENAVILKDVNRDNSDWCEIEIFILLDYLQKNVILSDDRLMDTGVKISSVFSIQLHKRFLTSQF